MRKFESLKCVDIRYFAWNDDLWDVWTQTDGQSAGVCMSQQNSDCPQD